MLKETEKMSDAALRKRGIKRVSTDVYHVGPYKYSKLADALAETERANAKQESAKQEDANSK